MITFERNIELDTAMKNLLRSMMDVNDYLSTILEYTGKVLTSQKEKELVELLKKYKLPHDRLQYDVKRLAENPYFKNIKLHAVNTESVKYENDIIKKRTLMSMNFHKAMGKYLFHYHPIGYFDTDVHMPVLKERDTIWMSPSISEMESMGDGIEKGHGKCMTMGLGIGVIPYLWLQKDSVESVTIVERNKDVIQLFETYIRPQFKTDKNLTIVHGDAFDYYTEAFLSQFDYVYVDFWESTEDGLGFYTRLMEKKVDYPHMDYWIEDSILCDVKYIVAPYLFTLYQGKSISDYIASIDGDLKGIAKKANRYFKSRNDVIRTEAELLDVIHGKRVLRDILAQ